MVKKYPLIVTPVSDTWLKRQKNSSKVFITIPYLNLVHTILYSSIFLYNVVRPIFSKRAASVLLPFV